jgi:chromatin remodeling complex protein RSC6|tara:strand:+ start:3574 stop:4296 length:723 start_codon:yes stop_codon:yes gene_type:complete
MPAAKTTTKKPGEQVEQADPVVAKKATKAVKGAQEPTVTAPTKSTKTKQPKPTKQDVKQDVKEDVKETVAPVTDAQNVVVQVDGESSITHGFSEFFTKFQAMVSQFTALKAELKTLERRTVKELKVVQKIHNKKRKKGTRAPSGFVKPSPISDELASFLGKEKGVEMARTDVTREINKYIRAHDLQDKENGRKINPDKPLRDLLKLTPDSDIVLTYFNLQRYMGPHFPKSVKTETTGTSV